MQTLYGWGGVAVRGVPPPLGVGAFSLVFVNACGVGFGVLAFCLKKNKSKI